MGILVFAITHDNIFYMDFSMIKVGGHMDISL